jgi:hypothetical protein
METPAFVVTLSASGVTLDNRSGRHLPFPAEHIIADVQKVFYPWLAPVSESFTGARAGVYENLVIHETYVDGRPLVRTFQRDDAIDRGELRVAYQGWTPGLTAPQRAELINAWFGYELTIVTVDQQRLPAQGLVSRGGAR